MNAISDTNVTKLHNFKTKKVLIEHFCKMTDYEFMPQQLQLQKLFKSQKFSTKKEVSVEANDNIYCLFLVNTVKLARYI